MQIKRKKLHEKISSVNSAIYSSFNRQNYVDVASIKTDDQTMQWMTKISSDSEMRITMMEMMLDQTKDNEVEMRKLVNTFMDNPGMQKIMMATHPNKSETKINSIEAKGMKNNNIKVGEMNKTEAVIKK